MKSNLIDALKPAIGVAILSQLIFFLGFSNAQSWSKQLERSVIAFGATYLFFVGMYAFIAWYRAHHSVDG